MRFGKEELWRVLVELSLLKWVILAGKVCRKVVGFEMKWKVWFS